MMNIIIGTIGANLTLGVITGLTTTITSLYTLSKALYKNSSNDKIDDIIDIITKSDIENDINIVKNLIETTEKHNDIIDLCIKNLNDVMNQIKDELDKINYRVKYNEKLWIKTSITKYDFTNCKKRLLSYIEVFNHRYKKLLEILSV